MIWYVALGSAVGGVSRFLLSGLLQRSAATTFPFWTLVINVTGSLLLGFLMRYFLEGMPASPELRAMLTTGFCGGYTTFSTFSYETVALFEQGDIGRGVWYIVLSVVLALAGMFAGMGLARELIAVQRGA